MPMPITHICFAFDGFYYYYYYKCHGLECCQSHSCGALYKNLDLKLLHSSMQTSADHRSRRRHVSRMTWRKRWDLVSLRNVKSEEQARVSSGRLYHACAAATGKARSPRVACIEKVLNNLLAISLDHLSVSTRHTRASNEKKFMSLPVRTDVFKYSFFPQCVYTYSRASSVVRYLKLERR